MNKISIITITYNSEAVLEKTMRSILLQNYRPLEYIIVDGASKDRTMDIVKRYYPIFLENSIEIKYISEPDSGISDAFNKGIRMASGDIIGIINSDDELREGTLCKVAQSIGDEVDVFYGDCFWVDNQKGISYVRKSSADLSDLRIKLKILHPATFIRADAYDKFGMYDIHYKYCMDKQLLAKMYYNGAKFQYVEEVLVNVTAGGVSDRYLRGVMEEGKRIAIENGIPFWKAQILFEKNYFIVTAISTLKKNRFCAELISRIKKGNHERIRNN